MKNVAFGFLALAGASLAGIGGATAQSHSLDGNWSGSGKVTFPSGAEEAARCRAHYSRESRVAYVVNATCATASGRVSQSATLRQTGANTFAGSFFNQEYGVTGSIRVVVQGSRQSVALDGGGATAWLRLSR